MVDRNLRSAAGNLETVITDFDVVTLLTAGVGLGGGLFAAEFASAWVMDRLGNQGEAVGFIGDIGSRLGVAVGFSQLAAQDFGPMLDTLMLLAAFGAVSSAALRLIEMVADAAAGNLSAPVKQNMTSARSAGSGAVKSVSSKKVSVSSSATTPNAPGPSGNGSTSSPSAGGLSYTA